MNTLRTLNWRYAVGELLIVFVGIMSAVQVDRWNTGRSERAAGRSYLERVVLDLEADLAYLTEIAEASRLQSEVADRFLLFMSDRSEVPPDSAVAAEVLEVLIAGGADGAFGLRTGTFRDMLSTGSLALIDDGGLRNALIAYYEDATVPLLESATEYQRSALYNPLQELFAAHVDYRVLYGSLANDPDATLLTTDWQSLRSDSELKTQLQRLSAGAFSIAGLYSRIAETTRGLRDQLAAAL